jgi:hypothetical protein
VYFTTRKGDWRFLHWFKHSGFLAKLTMTQTSLSLKEAAASVGRSKVGLLKAIQKGALSAAKDDFGQWQIEPAELYRVYTPVNGSYQQEAPADNTQVELRLLRELLAQSEATVMDLRQRLDVATEECQRLSLIVTSQLAQPQAPKGFWKRLLG